jgi:hypothetical protein
LSRRWGPHDTRDQIVACSPGTVYNVLRQADVLRQSGKESRKGKGSGLVPDNNRGCDNRIDAVPFSWPHVAAATSAMRLVSLHPSRISPAWVISGGAGWPQRNAQGIVM